MNNSDTVLGSTGSYWVVLGSTGEHTKYTEKSNYSQCRFFLKWDVDYKPKHVIGQTIIERDSVTDR